MAKNHVYISTASIVLALSFAMVCASVAGEPENRPARVDLRADQTPFRSQAGGTCMHYGVVAAMEAAYKRLGYGKLDLSEHFSVYFGAMFYYEILKMDGKNRTDEICFPDIRSRESNLAIWESFMFDGISEPCTLFGIPEERFFPLYVNMTVPNPFTDPADPYWADQYKVDTFNLDPRRLPLSAITAPAYYRIKSMKCLPREDAKSPEAIERVLASGYEVIWGFTSAGDMLSPVWRYTGPASQENTGHRMLLVGYDRSDPANRYFIAKNSAGPSKTPGAEGFTYLEYDYIRYGSWAQYITEVETPRPWPEVAHVGRWALEFGDSRGTFDLYHMPGMMDKAFVNSGVRNEQGAVLEDRRLGTFFIDGDPARPIRVNGRLEGARQTLFIDFENPASRWDKLAGWKIELTMDTRNPNLLTGKAIDPKGSSYKASAARNTVSTVTLPTEPIWEEYCRTSTNKEADAKDALARGMDAPVNASNSAGEPAAAIQAKWAELGGATGFLGKPEIEVSECPDRRGRYVHYAGGSIYWSPETGAHAIYGAIRDKWAELGWEQNANFGYPTSDEADAPNGGRFSQFGNSAAIYWHPDHGVFSLYREPYIAWIKSGGASGKLGYPVADMTMDGSDGKMTARFLGGVITCYPKQQAEIRYTVPK
ncbi:MAG: hypothetical protein WAX69_24305 [Victivallales bacterium]